MARNTRFTGLTVRRTPNVTDAFTEVAFTATIDPTSTTAQSLGTLPAGARTLPVQSLGGATGGSSPTVDIARTTSFAPAVSLANELPADNFSYGESVVGTQIGSVLTSDTEIFGRAGASVATGGTTTVLIRYLLEE